MKKIFLAILLAISFQFAVGQISLKEQNIQAIHFIKDRSILFNKNEIPIKIINFKKVMDSLDRKKVNYGYYTFIFYNNLINDENCIGGDGNVKVGRRAVPCIKYRIYNKGIYTYIEVLDGNSYM